MRKHLKSKGESVFLENIILNHFHNSTSENVNSKPFRKSLRKFRFISKQQEAFNWTPN